MLLTLEQEAKRQRLQMPSPERIRKVERSMIRLETVVNERETAVRLLQTGQEKGRPGAWRKNKFGYIYWYRFKEYAIPWYMNRRYKRKQCSPCNRNKSQEHLRSASSYRNKSDGHPRSSITSREKYEKHLGSISYYWDKSEGHPRSSIIYKEKS
uniref:Large ribosomal subunit protein uL29m n=1 Tax=Periophthalmus magnuspinnatus TaxID=409849 RepID=A0A3B4AG98_9GOBI